MRDKVNEYLNAGIAMVWVVHPERKTVAIYRPEDPFPVLLGEHDVHREPAGATRVRVPGRRLLCLTNYLPRARIAWRTGRVTGSN